MRLSRFALFVVAAAGSLATLPAIAAGAGKPDVANGKTIFEQRCSICHAVDQGPGGPVTGPSMVGIVGRKAATAPGFQMYSPALKKSRPHLEREDARRVPDDADAEGPRHDDADDDRGCERARRRDRLHGDAQVAPRRSRPAPGEAVQNFTSKPSV